MRGPPRDPDELWKRDDEEEERKVPPWIDMMANIGIGLALLALVATVIGLPLIYFGVQPAGNMLIVFALIGALIAMTLGFGGRIAKAERFDFGSR